MLRYIIVLLSSHELSTVCTVCTLGIFKVVNRVHVDIWNFSTHMSASISQILYLIYSQLDSDHKYSNAEFESFSHLYE